MSEIEHVQTRNEIETALTSVGMKPRHRFGQHFLIDGNLMRLLADSGEISRQDVVLEVGPGTGGLTDLLLPRAAHVICVEIDHQLQTLMEDRFSRSSNFTLIKGDILKTKNRLNQEVVSKVLETASGHAGLLKLVANLPYEVATPMLINMILSDLPIERYCFTVQKEVGERIMAEPGGKEYGPLAVTLQTTCQISLLTNLPPETFWPRPKINSSMFCLKRKDSEDLAGDKLIQFVNFVRQMFLHRRKTLRHNLKSHPSNSSMDKAESLFDLNLRPEKLSPEDWLKLAKTVLPYFVSEE